MGRVWNERERILKVGTMLYFAGCMYFFLPLESGCYLLNSREGCTFTAYILRCVGRVASTGARRLRYFARGSATRRESPKKRPRVHTTSGNMTAAPLFGVGVVVAVVFTL